MAAMLFADVAGYLKQPPQKGKLKLGENMRLFNTIRNAFFATFILLSAQMLSAEDAGKLELPIPELKISESASKGIAAGDWAAAEPAAVLEYEAVKEKALAAEKSDEIAAALTWWERVLDRTTCTEAQRSEARTHIKNLRPKVQSNTDPKKAKKWNVLVIIFKELKAERTEKDGKTTTIHKTFTNDNLKTVGQCLAGFRDLVFEWSSGLLIFEFDVKIVDEPLTRIRRDFPASPRDVAKILKEESKIKNKKYDTVIGYVKCRGDEGPNVNVPWTAAIYGRLGELDGAGYMMVPWGTNYPYKGETIGEMELHEWLHQIDDLVHVVLGYPHGTTRSPDDGRGEGDNRPDGEEEYKKPKDCTTWVYFYKHMMTEHMTRQIWKELTITENKDNKPGELIEIKK
ncbi:MAG: hypothetical protein LBQ66_07085 [Planctomycetaceae bacterium]|jgi:hypothetical protein|nr:hypothetical protein [Planctomycetaceae bacterium]